MTVLHSVSDIDATEPSEKGRFLLYFLRIFYKE